MKNLPTKADILSFIEDNPTKTNKRDIARAFGIKGAARIDLKRMLKELQNEGHLEKRRKTYREDGALPPVSVCRVTGSSLPSLDSTTGLSWLLITPLDLLLHVPPRDLVRILARGRHRAAVAQFLRDLRVRLHHPLVLALGADEFALHRLHALGGRLVATAA